MWAKVRHCCLLFFVAWSVTACHARENNMREISFDLGSSVEQTLRSHDVPYAGQNINGLMVYSFAGFKGDSTYLLFSRPGYEVRFGSIFGIDFYADLKRHPDQLVHLADASMGHEVLSSHAQAKAEIQKLISQFQGGKWKRYIPDTCPWVTGRSTMLNAAGQVDIGACPLDPALVFTAQEWPNLAAQKLRWQWIGDGRVATLEVQYAYNKPDVPTYTVNLQLELEEAVKFYQAKRRAEKNADRSAEEVAAGTERMNVRLKALEEAALKRGDQVIPRP